MIWVAVKFTQAYKIAQRFFARGDKNFTKLLLYEQTILQGDIYAQVFSFFY